jgi:hypothetical protein
MNNTQFAYWYSEPPAITSTRRYRLGISWALAIAVTTAGLIMTCLLASAPLGK